MKGYFSYLAKQSGVGFEEPRTKTRQADESPSQLLTKPLHVEETVLVEPGRRAEPARPVVDPKSGKDIQIQHPDVSPNISEPARKATAPGTPVVAGEHELVDDRRGREDHRSRTGEDDDTLFPKSPRNIREPKKEASEIPDVETTILIDPVQTPGFTDNVLPEQRPNDQSKKAEPFLPESRQQKSYFSKTEQLIEKDESDPIEIRDVLFREVQEWAAGTDVVDKAGSLDHPDFQKRLQTHEERTESWPQTGNDEQNAFEQTTLEEQNFSLSIGTISVVIEDSKEPVPPQPPKNQLGNTHGEVRRQYPRLRRNYL